MMDQRVRKRAAAGVMKHTCDFNKTEYIPWFEL
jgi:hypothetical protein